MAVLGRLLKRSIVLTGGVIRRRRLNGAKRQRKAFIKLLTRARYTAFGEQHDFAGLLDLAHFRADRAFYERFKATVPVHDYNRMHRDWWHRTQAGEPDVCWPGKVKYFALSSGTSESASKYIPVTKDMIKAMQRTSIRQILSLSEYRHLPPDLFEKGYLMLGGSTALKNSGHYFEGDLSGINQAKIPFWFERFYKPGKDIARIQDWEQKLDEITRRAKDWDIGYLVGVPAWCQLLLEKIIRHYNVRTIHDIWPNLEVFGHGGVSFEPYRPGFEKLLARPITYIETYLASEGFIAYQARPDTRGMRLALNQGIFFEFIPFNDRNFGPEGELLPNPETLMIDDVEEDREYALLLSTCAGAWRYLIGDTVRFTSKKQYEIVITGRTKHFLSLCGEHLSVDNMNKAIELAARHFGISIPEFTVAGVPHDTLFAHHWFVGTDQPVDSNLLRNCIDDSLKRLNDDYAVERRHALREVRLTVLPLAVFYDWMAQKGKMGGQHKFPRVLRHRQVEEWQRYVDQYAGAVVSSAR
jgi:hypothetical protein